MNDPVAHAAVVTPIGPQRFPLEPLLGTREERILRFREQEYHLRVTQNAKLILTK